MCTGYTVDLLYVCTHTTVQYQSAVTTRVPMRQLSVGTKFSMSCISRLARRGRGRVAARPRKIRARSAQDMSHEPAADGLRTVPLLINEGSF